MAAPTRPCGEYCCVAVASGQLHDHVTGNLTLTWVRRLSCGTKNGRGITLRLLVYVPLQITRA